MVHLTSVQQVNAALKPPELWTLIPDESVLLTWQLTKFTIY